MESAFFSSRSSSAPGDANPANTNKTSTFCLTLGRFFTTAPAFFRTLDEELDSAFDVRIVVLGEVQLGNMPEFESGREFVAEIVPGVVERGQRFLLFPLGSAHRDAHRRMTP